MKMSNPTRPAFLEKRGGSLRILTAAVALIGLQLACVTVNVNFPESAVQKATDDYVRDLYRAKEKGKSPIPSATPHQSSLEKIIRNAYSEIGIPSAWADGDFVFKVNSERATQIKGRLASRLDDVLNQKRAGVVGESNDGKLVLKNPDRLKKLLEQKVKALVESENQDREELYKEILKANGLPEARLADIRKSFARSFQAESPSGTPVQGTDGGWTAKP